MKTYDFEYDGIRLSDFGCIICEFDNDGSDTVSNGSEITLNTFSVLNGKQELASSEYEECIESTIQICKNDCINQAPEMSVDDIRRLTSWLNRKSFHKFKMLDGDYTDLYFEASFNVSRIELGGITYGLELQMITNRPHALQEPISILLSNTEPNKEYTIISESDDEGFIYPYTKIEINEAGDLTIYCEPEKRTTLIKNCQKGEVITLDYPIIQSSLDSHKIATDFNWTFPRITNTFQNSLNKIQMSLPCTITMTYSPIAKISV